jgi:hypothetical protein
MIALAYDAEQAHQLQQTIHSFLTAQSGMEVKMCTLKLRHHLKAGNSLSTFIPDHRQSARDTSDGTKQAHSTTNRCANIQGPQNLILKFGVATQECCKGNLAATTQGSPQ